MKKFIVWLSLLLLPCFSVSAIITGAGTNATQLNGATFAAPGPIGSGTASTGAFTGLTATTINGNTITTGSSTFTGTAAQTYTFPSATSTLADITTGSWTPTDGSGAALSFSQAAGTYVKIGKLVFLSARVTYPATADVSQAVINIPFTAGVAGNPQYNSVGATVTAGTAVKCQVDRGTTLLYFYAAGSTAATNAGQSALVVDFSITYQTP